MPPGSLVIAPRDTSRPQPSAGARYIRLWRIRAMWWVGTFVTLILLLWILGPIVTPFLVGAFVAYFLNPLVSLLERRRIPRALSSAVLVVSMMALILATIILLLPSLLSEANDLIRAIPGWYDAAQNAVARMWPSVSRAEASGAAADLFERIRETMTEAGVSVLGGVITSLNSIVQFVVFWVLMPVVAFYLLMDWQRLVSGVEALVPRANLSTVRELARDVDIAIAGFVRGVIVVCIILAIYYASLLGLVGLNFGLLIGVFAGFVAFIPYVGAFVSGTLAIGIALGQFWEDPVSIALVVGIFVVGQIVEARFLVPRIVSSSASVHPVWLIFAVFAFGYLFGLPGAIAAVPLVAALAVLVRFAVHEYHHSPVYAGTFDVEG